MTDEDIARSVCQRASRCARGYVVAAERPTMRWLTNRRTFDALSRAKIDHLQTLTGVPVIAPDGRGGLLLFGVRVEIDSLAGTEGFPLALRIEA